MIVCVFYDHLKVKTLEVLTRANIVSKFETDIGSFFRLKNYMCNAPPSNQFKK